MELAGKDLERQRVLQFALDGALERAGAEIGVIADLGQILAGGLG